VATRLGIHVEERRQPPSVVAHVEQAVVLEMVVGVGYEDPEHHARPEFGHVAFRVHGDRAQRVGDIGVGADRGADLAERRPPDPA